MRPGQRAEDPAREVILKLVEAACGVGPDGLAGLKKWQRTAADELAAYAEVEAARDGPGVSPDRVARQVLAAKRPDLLRAQSGLGGQATRLVADLVVRWLTRAAAHPQKPRGRVVGVLRPEMRVVGIVLQRNLVRTDGWPKRPVAKGMPKTLQVNEAVRELGRHARPDDIVWDENYRAAGPHINGYLFELELAVERAVEGFEAGRFDYIRQLCANVPWLLQESVRFPRFHTPLVQQLCDGRWRAVAPRDVGKADNIVQRDRVNWLLTRQVPTTTAKCMVALDELLVEVGPGEGQRVDRWKFEERVLKVSKAVERATSARRAALRTVSGAQPPNGPAAGDLMLSAVAEGAVPSLDVLAWWMRDHVGWRASADRLLSRVDYGDALRAEFEHASPPGWACSSVEAVHVVGAAWVQFPGLRGNARTQLVRLKAALRGYLPQRKLDQDTAFAVYRLLAAMLRDLGRLGRRDAHAAWGPSESYGDRWTELWQEPGPRELDSSAKRQAALLLGAGLTRRSLAAVLSVMERQKLVHEHGPGHRRRFSVLVVQELLEQGLPVPEGLIWAIPQAPAMVEGQGEE